MNANFCGPPELPDHFSSRSRNSAFVAFGSAFPLERFMTSPMKKPRSPFLP
jgi:hypothetical protein